MDDRRMAALLCWYEEMRGNVMLYHSVGAAGRMGLAVWLHTWMDDRYAPAIECCPSTPVVGRLANGDVTAQLVALMTTMALNRQPEVHP